MTILPGERTVSLAYNILLYIHRFRKCRACILSSSNVTLFNQHKFQRFLVRFFFNQIPLCVLSFFRSLSLFLCQVISTFGNIRLSLSHPLSFALSTSSHFPFEFASLFPPTPFSFILSLPLSLSFSTIPPLTKFIQVSTFSPATRLSLCVNAATSSHMVSVCI